MKIWQFFGLCATIWFASAKPQANAMAVVATVLAVAYLFLEREK